MAGVREGVERAQNEWDFIVVAGNFQPDLAAHFQVGVLLILGVGGIVLLAEAFRGRNRQAMNMVFGQGIDDLPDRFRG